MKSACKSLANTIAITGVASVLTKLTYGNMLEITGLMQNISDRVNDFCYATTILGNPCVSIGVSTANFVRCAYAEMQQLYQVFSSKETALNYGIGVLNSTSTFLSNACCTLGQQVVNSEDKQQQAISGLFIVSTGIIAVEALYKFSRRNSKLPEPKQKALAPDKLNEKPEAKQDDKKDDLPVPDVQHPSAKRNSKWLYPTMPGANIGQHLAEVMKARREQVDKALAIT